MIVNIVWIALAILSVDGHPPPGRGVAALMSWQTTSIPASKRASVEQEVSAIWQRLGVPIEWRVPRPGELRVTIIVKDHTRSVAGSPAPLGWVHFVGTEPTAVLYASATAAWQAVEQGRSDDLGKFSDGPLELQQALAARLLGRAIAHELGHYLLGSRAHTTRGLMRPTLDVVDALTRGTEAYGLDRSQRAALHQRFALLWVRARAGDAAGASHS